VKKQLDGYFELYTLTETAKMPKIRNFKILTCKFQKIILKSNISKTVVETSKMVGDTEFSKFAVTFFVF